MSYLPVGDQNIGLANTPITAPASLGSTDNKSKSLANNKVIMDRKYKLQQLKLQQLKKEAQAAQHNSRGLEGSVLSRVATTHGSIGVAPRSVRAVDSFRKDPPEDDYVIIEEELE